MSVKYKTGDDEVAHFITFSVVYWIDVLTRVEYKNIIIKSLEYCLKEKGLRLYAWVIRSNHVHLVMSVHGGFTISNTIRDLKKFTSKQLYSAIKDNPAESRKEWTIWLLDRAGRKNSNNTNFQFWQQDNHPVELSNFLMLKEKIDYIHNNPVKAGIVYEADQYIYSSAIDYFTNRKGMLEIEHLQLW